MEPDGFRIVSRFGSTEVRIERQARRTVQISIKKNWILIKAPHGVSESEIGAFVAQNKAWIEAQLARLHPQRSVDSVLLLGEQWRIEPARDASLAGGVELDKTARIIFCSAPSSDSDWSRIYRKAARDLLPALFKSVSQSVGLPPPPLSLKTLPRAWGMCHSSGRIELHWGLVKLEREQAIYVMCHELAHLTHMDHSPAFWALSDRYCPGARRFDRSLKSATPPEA